MKEFALKSILDDMPHVLKWLEEIGQNAFNSRYSRYVKDIDNFFLCRDPTSVDGRDKFDKLISSYVECINIVALYRAFRNEKSRGFLDRLSKVIDGQDHPETGSEGSSRDYMFELLIAARMSLSGFEIDFNRVTDVVAESDEFLIFGECKRISSEKKFERNFKDAAKQVVVRAESFKKRVYGLVFLDVSSCLGVVPKVVLPNTQAAEWQIKSRLFNFVQRNQSKIARLNERFSKSSLGVCLIGSMPIFVQEGTLFSATSTEVITPEDISDEDFESLHKILAGFSSSMDSLL